MKQADFVLVNEGEIQGYRDTYLAPLEIIVRLVRGRRYLFNAAPGLGKTEAAIRIINNPITRKRFSKIAFVGSRRDLLEQVAKRISPWIKYVIYPDLEDGSICHGKYDERLSEWHPRGFSRLIKAEVCSGCPDLKECAYAHRGDPDHYKDAYVVLLTEQLLKHRPDFLVRMGFDDTSLIFVDECVGADAGSVATFHAVTLQIEIDVCRVVGASYLTDLFGMILKQPSKFSDSSAARESLQQDLLHIETEGSKTRGFRYITHTALAYADKPLWYEAGTFAVQQFPVFPGTTVFMGGYLNANYVAWRYGLDSLEQLVPRAVACHEGTRIINIDTPLAAASRFPYNRKAIINFAVDFIIFRILAGLTTALLMRCDKRPDDVGGCVKKENLHMTNAIADIMIELRARGFGHVRIIPAGETLPELPSPTVVPVVTFGMAGLGRFEDYEAIFAVHAYHIDPKVLADHAYDDLPPSLRPSLAFARGRRRVLDWSKSPTTSPELRRRADLMLERMEIDTTVQAIQRIRCGIKPRLVIANMRCDPKPYLGKVETAQNLTAVRLMLGLPLDTRTSRQQQQAAAVGALIAQGQTLAGAAVVMGLSRTTVTTLRSTYGSSWTVPKGRPSNLGESAQNPPIETLLVDSEHLSLLTQSG